MLTHVTDHLIKRPIPVFYLDPTQETQAEKYDQLTALVASVQAAQAEYVAMYQGKLDCAHFADDTDTDFTDLQGPTLDRMIAARDAVDLQVRDMIGFGQMKAA